MGSSLGQVFGTIGGDNKFKLWREDPSQTPRGGRRFRPIFSQSPSSHVAYVAIDIKTVRAEAWVVLMTHDGLLNLLEPLEPESLASWRETDAFYPFGQQSRSSEPRYGLSLQPTEAPCYDAICAGLDLNALSLAVSATGVIKILRGLKADESGYQFYEMLEIATESPQINDLAWVPGCIRPFDLVAAACDDGYVRLFRIDIPHDANASRAALSQRVPSARASTGNAGTAPSGIGAGLAGVSRTAARQSSGAPRIRHEWQELASLQSDRKAVWKVRWMNDGESLYQCIVERREPTGTQVALLSRPAMTGKRIFGDRV